MSRTDLALPLRLLRAGCACGMAASILLPWYTLSCVVFAASAAVFGVAGFLARGVGSEFGMAVKLAAATAVVFAASIPLQTTAVHMLMALAGAVLLYFCVTYMITGLERAAGRGPKSDWRPPRVVMLFEYCAGIYALAFLAADAFPSIEALARWVAMASFAVGFVVLLQYLNAYAKEK